MIFTKNEEQILALERTTGSPRRTVQRSACFTLLIPTASTTNRGFSRIAQRVDRFCSPNRPDPIPYTLYPQLPHAKLFQHHGLCFQSSSIPQTRTSDLSHGLSNAGSLPGCAKASSTKSVTSDCITFICFLNDQVLALALASGQPPSSTPTPHQLTRTTFKSSFRRPRPHPLPSTGLASQRYSSMFLEHAQVFYVKNSLFCGNLCSLFARYTLLQPNSLCSQLYGLQGD